MGFDRELDAERWLRQQNGVVHDLFDRAATELQNSGIRLLLGSTPPILEELDSGKRITIRPLRFASSNGNESLSLSLLATIRGGAPRYVVVLEVSGPLTCQALQKLASEYEDVWDKAYLRTGLWIGEDANTRRLSEVSQIRESTGEKLCITGVFLHSDLSRTIQQGVMVMGMLYRSVLDELSNAGKMRRLYAQLSNCLDNVTPRFQRMIQP
jgi:hypothetical protein